MNLSIPLSAVLLTMGFSASLFAEDPSLKTDEQKASYALGRQVGQGMKSQGIELELEAFSLAVSDALSGKESRLTDGEMQASMDAMQKRLIAQQQEQGRLNKAEGEKFLAENKTKKGVRATKSGLQYEVLKAGKGDSPQPTDRVRVHYRGTLIDGTEFDSSYKRNAPAEFGLQRVIRGWTEALTMMEPGAKWKLIVPSELAYGESGRPGIPPNSALIFEVELLDVLKQ
ncbi:MAG: FKBP-type peptidyl-prolyl cis-trans isomerase [Elusimicrobia bacterium]|nr:FKBP-type peptidyl-prolyl cis-trans isomerase [Elusimicrobiota bacterium]